MTILYKGFIGGPPEYGWGIVAGILALISLIGTITEIFYLRNKDGAWFGLLSLFFIMISIGLLINNQKPIIKATVDDTIPWKEIDKDYKFESQEGNIYTFVVKNKTIEEWKLIIEEEQK